MNLPKALRGWISPDGIMEMLDKDVAAANAAADRMCSIFTELIASL